MFEQLFDAALLESVVRAMVPILLAALGGMICERAGVFQIAMEGMMLAGAFAAVAGSYLAVYSGLGVLFGVAAGVLVSIDTSKPGVAEAAIEAGAAVLNDVTALEDPGMASLCASSGVGVVLMHMRGNPRTMQIDPHYADVVAEVSEFLRRRIGAATAAGVDRHTIAVDPGIGFGKTLQHNLALLNGLPDLAELGRPVLVGASRKAFLGALTDRPVEERDGVTGVASGIGAMLGASVMRVHDVPSTRDALALADAMVAAMDKGDGDRQ